MNAVEIEEAVSNLALEPFDRVEFPFAFLSAFGNKETTIKRLRAGASNKSDLGGILQTNNLHILVANSGEVTRSIQALKNSPATTKAKVQFIVATDGETFEAEDQTSGETIACGFQSFPDHFGFFLPLAGISTVKQIRESSFDIRATSRLNRLYIELLKDTFEKYTEINQGDFFIVDGVIAYVAEVNNPFVNDDGRQDARLRLIYSSGAESNLLMRSLQKALWRDESGRRLVKPDLGPLFRDTIEEGDEQSGTLYVLRSLSTVPFISEHRSVIHKIGVTGGQIETRIANAALDPTFLLADVEIVATYKLADINRTKIEKLLHRIFSRAQLELTIKDRFGNPVKPREWFMQPLKVIDDAVVRIRDGSITRVMYDPETASLVEDKN